MNFKERGITVGDLLILTTFVLFVFFITGKLRDKQQQTSFINQSQENILLNRKL